MNSAKKNWNTVFEAPMKAKKKILHQNSHSLTGNHCENHLAVYEITLFFSVQSYQNIKNLAFWIWLSQMVIPLVGIFTVNVMKILLSSTLQSNTRKSRILKLQIAN